MLVASQVRDPGRQARAAWRPAIEVPDLASLNKGGIGRVNSVSCASAGNCAAGGSYHIDSSRSQQAFVVGETSGTWGTAIGVSGSGALGANPGVTSVSCASAGNCAASGSYLDGHSHGQAFVVSQANDTWGTAIEVPGTGALTAGGAAFARSVSCRSAGNCAVGGSYRDGSGHFQAFVDSQG